MKTGSIKQNKRGMSAIIVTLLLVALSIGLIAIVWGVVNNMIGSKIHSASSCFGESDKVTLNSQYTCYNSSEENISISINVGDIALEGIVVAVSGPSGSQTFTITNKSQTISHVYNYNGSTLVSIPEKNSGQTYIYAWQGSTTPGSIEISPIIGGTTCSSSDSISPIDDCYKFS